jgi:transcriptional regulator with XRE-family HTH domain
MRLVGREIRSSRKASRTTQEQLATAIETDKTSVSHIEAGRQEVNISRLARIARRLRVTVSSLVAPLDGPLGRQVVHGPASCPTTEVPARPQVNARRTFSVT